ncbi:zf-HC2 domain-containing protein [Paenibacillus sp. sptzw28]|uniref:anti-sigma factor family protein n=1 Tax=Paenibacillus sp. sptzw28 TaxID=715179 RepID=UPI001C6EE693|nr:zf-HC2 domain-containing protein [Paenibacillus sp. sptzw28]QYR19273.1 zf-HC2 domain-containing protein [Paenibacillus sp. sptzw28]
MSHYSLEQWTRYVRQELSNEERQAYETHLGTCDHCLARYMQSLELNAEDSFPTLTKEAQADMAEVVMQHIGSAEIAPLSLSPDSSGKKSTGKSYTRNPLFHYAVAAAITFLLMGTGAFQTLAERVGKAETNIEASEAEQGEIRSSVSQIIMEKTIVMLDSIQPKHEKGGTR